MEWELCDLATQELREPLIALGAPWKACRGQKAKGAFSIFRFPFETTRLFIPYGANGRFLESA